MAGYSKKSLKDKLGVPPGIVPVVRHAPPDYVRLLGVAMSPRLKERSPFIQSFVRTKTELESEFPKLRRSLRANGSLWISWPKKSAGVKSDLNENVIRTVGLQNGLVDVKVAAIDDMWSGLKFVYRLKDR
jgi:hypothetical protein